MIIVFNYEIIYYLTKRRQCPNISHSVFVFVLKITRNLDVGKLLSSRMLRQVLCTVTTNLKARTQLTLTSYLNISFHVAKCRPQGTAARDSVLKSDGL
jgi:hypothetical protein